MPLHVWLPERARERAEPRLGAHVGRAHQDGNLRHRARHLALPRRRRLGGGRRSSCSAVVSGVLGVAYAIGQHDIKRLLAYHSVENIGIILWASGSRSRALGASPELVLLGIAGALLPHVESRPLQGAALPRRGLADPRDRHARDRSVGRARDGRCRAPRSPSSSAPWRSAGCRRSMASSASSSSTSASSGRVAGAGARHVALRARSARRRSRSSARCAVACFVKVVRRGLPRRAALGARGGRARVAAPAMHRRDGGARDVLRLHRPRAACRRAAPRSRGRRLGARDGRASPAGAVLARLDARRSSAAGSPS